VSDQNLNPPTDNVGGGDDSQSRFKETFVIVKQIINSDTDDGFTYLNLETFLSSVPEHKKINVEDQIMYGLTISQDFIDNKESDDYLPGSIYFRKEKAILFQGEYFVLQNVI
jgi:hypothetical protein